MARAVALAVGRDEVHHSHAHCPRALVRKWLRRLLVEPVSLVFHGCDWTVPGPNPHDTRSSCPYNWHQISEIRQLSQCDYTDPHGTFDLSHPFHQPRLLSARLHRARGSDLTQERNEVLPAWLVPSAPQSELHHIKLPRPFQHLNPGPSLDPDLCEQPPGQLQFVLQLHLAENGIPWQPL